MPPKKKKVQKKAVQISIDPGVLKEIDANEKTKQIGRSAFIIACVLRVMREQKSEEVDAAIRRGYEGQEDAIYEEMKDFIHAPGGELPEDDLVEHVRPARARRAAGAR